jgi:hypothetical protein
MDLNGEQLPLTIPDEDCGLVLALAPGVLCDFGALQRLPVQDASRLVWNIRSTLEIV